MTWWCVWLMGLMSCMRKGLSIVRPCWGWNTHPPIFSPSCQGPRGGVHPQWIASLSQVGRTLIPWKTWSWGTKKGTAKCLQRTSLIQEESTEHGRWEVEGSFEKFKLDGPDGFQHYWHKVCVCVTGALCIRDTPLPFFYLVPWELWNSNFACLFNGRNRFVLRLRNCAIQVQMF